MAQQNGEPVMRRYVYISAFYADLARLFRASLPMFHVSGLPMSYWKYPFASLIRANLNFSNFLLHHEICIAASSKTCVCSSKLLRTPVSALARIGVPGPMTLRLKIGQPTAGPCPEFIDSRAVPSLFGRSFFKPVLQTNSTFLYHFCIARRGCGTTIDLNNADPRPIGS
jgi:hypothetical protein